MTDALSLHTSYGPVLISDGVRASAQRTPSKLALAMGDETRTFAQLVDRIDRVASVAMAGLGLNRGDRVAIMAPNCLEFIELMLGLASAGLVSVMVNSRGTPRDVAHIVEDSGARVLVLHPSVEEVGRAADLPSVERIVVIGEEYERLLASARPSQVWRPQEDPGPFMLGYTSGTTGEPKGVPISHRSRVLSFFAMSVEYGVCGPDDRGICVPPMYHGAGFVWSVAPIFFGGFCQIVSRFDPEQVMRLVQEIRATQIFLVPTHFSAIFDLPAPTLDALDTSSLTSIISNAAPLAQSMKHKIVERFGDGVLHESYGSTEGGFVTNLRPVDQLRKERCVGLPFPLTEVRVVGDDGAELGPGEVGELYSRSPYLFDGYWQRPDATAASFVDGWFSAGDLAHRDEEGMVYIVDRKNDKIISGAVNIFPREVEEVMLGHPSIADVAVFGVPDDYWGEAVCAAVVTRPGASLSQDEVEAFARASLADYKRPKQIHLVEKLPRNPSGKVLRRVLRDQFADDSSLE